jgi:hypothetical protein
VEKSFTRGDLEGFSSSSKEHDFVSGGLVMKKVLAFVGIAVLMSSVAVAEVNSSKISSTEGVTAAAGARTPGTLGSFTISLAQIGPLEVQIDAQVTTQGGDGIPRAFNTGGGGTTVLNDIVWLYGQIYDAPWQGGCTHWATPGPNWCGYGSEQAINTPNANLNLSFTTTVPAADDYEIYASAVAGATWPTTGYLFGYIDASTSTGPLGPYYIDNTQPPTPTPPPGGYGGNPIPTLNWLGILAMVAILGGVAVLVMTRK